MHTNDDHAPPLAAMMEALRADVAGLSSPASVEAALMQAFASQHRRPSWLRRHAALLWSAGGAVGAGALALTLVLGSQPPSPQPPGRIAQLVPANAPSAPPLAAVGDPPAAMPSLPPPARTVRHRSPRTKGLPASPPALLAQAPVAASHPDAEEVPSAVEGFGNGSEFIAIASAESINRATDTRLVRRDVRRVMFASLGVTVTPQNADDLIHAEMLVDGGGEPLALRLLTLQ
ncbi:MAG: hypothetical protein ABIT83_14445 [Massilia sp.]